MGGQRTLKRLNFSVPPDLRDQPILRCLRRLQPSWTKVFAIKMIRSKNVRVNGARTAINYRLREGDRLEIYGSDPAQNPPDVPLNLERLRPLRVVFENENLIIVDKEAKMASQADEKHSFNNMNNRLLNHLGYRGDPGAWRPVFIHRLDYNTTGLLIGVKNYRTHREMSAALKGGHVEKHYRALVHGIVKFKERTIRCHLLKGEGKVKAVDRSTPGSRESITEATLIRHLFPLESSLLSLRLITGRTHQIRAHLSLIGHPIRGDQKYGAERDRKNYPHPALTANRLVFSADLPGETLRDLRGRTFEKEDI